MWKSLLILARVDEGKTEGREASLESEREKEVRMCKQLSVEAWQEREKGVERQQST